MPAKCILKKENNALVPDTRQAIDILEKIKEGTYVNVTITIPRNIRFHNLYFALLRVLLDAQTEPAIYKTEDELHEAIKKALGYIEKKKDIYGNVYWQTKSIAFDKMDETDFKKYWDEVIHLVTSKLLPKTKKKNIEEEVYKLIGDKANARKR